MSLLHLVIRRRPLRPFPLWARNAVRWVFAAALVYAAAFMVAVEVTRR